MDGGLKMRDVTTWHQIAGVKINI